ncbi:Ig-like domain-containing protein [Candidatus Solirubrobacter pratensis]|uniref:Ig-like domain-containing protein n=1 Tax=Candidatus Solirubrobacter pratensis TaxID=1298857 RepID=UPI000412D78E|nr:Ig-like domain-containing protein [Candidatus Solirubrobacter pratensis]
MARAAVGDEFVDACLNTGAAKPNCAAAPGISAAWPEVLSPDGRQLYVAAAGNGASEPAAVITFDRDPATGKLARRPNGCVTKTGSSGACVQASQLDNPQDIIISPDGTSVYVSNVNTRSIIELRRAPDGSLTLINECQGIGAPCTAITGMGVPHSLALSPDGTTLYARTTQSAAGSGQGLGTLLVFTRSADGRLTQKAAPDGCWSEAPQGSCTTAAGIAQQGWQMAVTNTNLYTVGHNDGYLVSFSICGNPPTICAVNQPPTGSVAVFGRKANGTLTQAADPNGCISNTGATGGAGFFTPLAPMRCKDGNDALDQARSVTVSPDGNSVYVGTANAIITYARNGASGALTEKSCLRRAGMSIAGCTDGTAIGDVYRMAVTPDGGDLIAGSNTFNGFTFLTRDPNTGALSQKAGTKRCLTTDGSGGSCEALPALGGFGNAVVSADSQFVYLTGNGPGAVVTMHRDFAPTCDSKTISVPYQTSVAVPLTCTDRNGDALSLAVAAQPLNGTLGGGGTIDSSNNTVRYSPPLGFSGPDSFQYTATGQGVRSSAATVTLDVQPAPAVLPGPQPTPAPLPPQPPQKLSVVLGFAFSSSTAKLTKFTRLSVSGVPAGATVTVTCIKGTCPTALVKKKTVKKRGKKQTTLVAKPLVLRDAFGTINLSKLISKPLKAGTRLRVDVTRPGAIGAVKIMEVGKRKAPKVTTQCLPPGATKPASC